MVDIALQRSEVRSCRRAQSRAKVLDRLRVGDIFFRGLTRAAALAVLVILGGVIVALISGAWPALSTFGITFLFDESWNPVTERFGAIAPDLRHDRHVPHRDGHRGAGRADDRGVPDRTLPDDAAASDRNRYRVARRDSQHHLRHLGLVRLRAVPAAIRAAGADRGFRRHPLALETFLPVPPTASEC